MTYYRPFRASSLHMALHHPVSMPASSSAGGDMENFLFFPKVFFWFLKCSLTSTFLKIIKPNNLILKRHYLRH